MASSAKINPGILAGVATRPGEFKKRTTCIGEAGIPEEVTEYSEVMRPHCGQALYEPLAGHI